jgi:hypothetical protein
MSSYDVLKSVNDQLNVKLDEATAEIERLQRLHETALNERDTACEAHETAVRFNRNLVRMRQDSETLLTQAERAFIEAQITSSPADEFAKALRVIDAQASKLASLTTEIDRRIAEYETQRVVAYSDDEGALNELLDLRDWLRGNCAP